MDKQTVAQPHDGMGGNSDTHYHTDGPQGHHAAENNLITKGELHPASTQP